MTCSFKFVVSAFGSTISAKEQLRTINSFSYLGFQGPIDMKTPDAQFHVLEDYGCENANANSKPVLEPIYIYMGKLVREKRVKIRRDSYHYRSPQVVES